MYSCTSLGRQFSKSSFKCRTNLACSMCWLHVGWRVWIVNIFERKKNYFIIMKYMRRMTPCISYICGTGNKQIDTKNAYLICGCDWLRTNQQKKDVLKCNAYCGLLLQIHLRLSCLMHIWHGNDCMCFLLLVLLLASIPIERHQENAEKISEYESQCAYIIMQIVANCNH